MNWEKEIICLRDPKIKRIRKTAFSFPGSKEREIPFSAPIPKDTGFCRRPLPRDFLYVIENGNDQNQNQKRICCGHFSQELLNTVKQKINSEPAA